MRFKGILRFRQADTPDRWIDDEIGTNLVRIMRFARTLHSDVYAVRRGIELLWSSRRTEGKIDSLKTLKRSMYGRAGAEFLRAQTLLLRHTD